MSLAISVNFNSLFLAFFVKMESGRVGLAVLAGAGIFVLVAVNVVFGVIVAFV